MPRIMAYSNPPSLPTDGEEVRAFLAGDRQAFERLVDRYQHAVLRLCQRLLPASLDPSDLFQDAFLQAFQSVDSLREPEAFRTWLFRIVVRKARRQRPVRRPEQAREDTDHEAEDPRTPDQDLERAEDRSRLKRCLLRLPQRQREVVALRHYEELNFLEIASILGIREDAARASHYQGLRRLRQEMLEPES